MGGNMVDAVDRRAEDGLNLMVYGLLDYRTQAGSYLVSKGKSSRMKPISRHLVIVYHWYLHSAFLTFFSTLSFDLDVMVDTRSNAFLG
jgi:hypothetical protein